MPNTVAFGANAQSRVKNENADDRADERLAAADRSVSVPMPRAPIVMPTRPIVITAVAPLPRAPTPPAR